MNQTIEAREVNSQGPRNSSSNVSRKDQLHPSAQQQDFLKLIQGINRFGSLDQHLFTNQQPNSAPLTQHFYQQSETRATNVNQPLRYFQRNQTDSSSFREKKMVGVELSPIRRFQNEQQHPSEAPNFQGNDILSNKNYQSPVPNVILRHQQHFASNSVSDYISKYKSEYLSGGIDRPQTQRIEGRYIDRYNYSSGEQDKKYRSGSDYETKPQTQRDDGNVTGLSSLNSSYKKITNFSATNDISQLPLVRPYSTFNLANRPQSQNPIDQNRPISYQEQNNRFQIRQQNHFDNRSGINNLTALESEGIIEEDKRYMRNFFDRPYTGYQNEAQFTPIYQPARTNISERNYYANQNHSRSINLQQENINKKIEQEPLQLKFSNISEIKRPHYENKYVQTRELRKLGGEEEPKVVFKNNWWLLALLLLLLLGLIGFGVWIGRNSFLEKQKYASAYTEATEQEPGVKPTYVDPTQIKHVNVTQSKNQTTQNQSIPAKPIEYPPISIKITIVNPQIETRNDTIIKPQPQKPVLNASVLPQQIPIVFPSIESIAQNTTTVGTNVPIVQNETQKPIQKPTTIEPIVVPTKNITVVAETNITEIPAEPIVAIQVIKPSIDLGKTNITTPNISVPIQPVVTPTQPVVIPVKPVVTPIQPVVTPTQPIVIPIKPVVTPTQPIKTPIEPSVVISPNITSTSIDQNVSNITTNESKPISTIEKKPEAEYIQAQQVKDINEYQGYQPTGQLYFPIEQKQEYFTQPTKSNDIYPQVVAYNDTFIEPSKPFVQPPIAETEINNIYVLPSTSIQFDQVYQQRIVENNISDIFIEPTEVPKPILTPQVVPSVTPSINASVIANVTQPTKPTVIQPVINISQPITSPESTLQPTIEPSMIEPTIVPAESPTQKKPISQQVPSYLNDYIQPQNVTDFQVSIPSIKQEVDLLKINNQSIPSQVDTLYTEPSIVPSKIQITKPEKIQNQYVPSTVQITPTSIQTPYSINPITAPIDMGTFNISAPTVNITEIIIEPQVTPVKIEESQTGQNITKVPQKPTVIQNPPEKPTIIQKVPQAPYVEPQNISDFERSILPDVEPIQQKPQSTSFVAPTQTPSVEPQIQFPSTFVSPQPIYPSSIQPSIISPEIIPTSSIQMIDNTINASKDQIMTIFPQIVDNNTIQPQKNIDLPQVQTPISKPVQVLPVKVPQYVPPFVIPATFVEPLPGIIKNPKQPFETQPTSIEPQTFVIPALTINESIAVQQIMPAQITSIPVESIEITPNISKVIQINPIPVISKNDSVQPQVILPSEQTTINATQLLGPIKINPIEITPQQIIPSVVKPVIIPVVIPITPKITPQITPLVTPQALPIVTPEIILSQVTFGEIRPQQTNQSQTIPAQTISAQILPQETISSDFTAPIQIPSNQTVSPQVITPQPVTKIPTNQSWIQPSTPEMPGTPSTPYFVLPSIEPIIQTKNKSQQFLPAQVITPTNVGPQIPATKNQTQFFIQPITTPLPTPSQTQLPARPTKDNKTQQIQPIINELPSLQPKTVIISQTNFTNPDEFIMNRVKRLTPIQQSEVIYEIPQGYDRSKLAEIEKNFLAFYNQTLQQKSPVEIIPLNWKSPKDSTLLAENQYPIYFTHNRTQGSNSVNYLPSDLPIKITSPYSKMKETIVEISPTGQMTVLQKGSDWAEISKNMETYKGTGNPAALLPNILKPQLAKNRHSLRRND